MKTEQQNADIRHYWPEVEGNPSRVAQIMRDLDISLYELAAALNRPIDWMREYFMRARIPLGTFDASNERARHEAQSALDTWARDNGVRAPNLSDPNFEYLAARVDPVAAWVHYNVSTRMMQGGPHEAIVYHARAPQGDEHDARDARFDPGLTEEQAREATLWSRLTAETARAAEARFGV